MSAGMPDFDEWFCSVVEFSDGTYVIEGGLPRDVAEAAFITYFQDSVEDGWEDFDGVLHGVIKPSRVVWGADMAGETCWYYGCGDVPGSRAVWVYTP